MLTHYHNSDLSISKRKVCSLTLGQFPPLVQRVNLVSGTLAHNSIVFTKHVIKSITRSVRIDSEQCVFAINARARERQAWTELRNKPCDDATQIEYAVILPYQ